MEKRSAIQREPTDPAEQEADQVAAQVIGEAPGTTDLSPSPGGRLIGFSAITARRRSLQ